MSNYRLLMPFVVGASITLLGCSSSSKSSATSSSTAAAGAATVNVTLTDVGGYKVLSSSTSAKAGDVDFVVKNTGTIEHEMLVIKTDVPFDQIAVTDAGDPPVSVASGANKIDEADSVADTDEDLKPGETRHLTAKDLKPGSYVLACNIAGHYQLGMRAAFNVTS